jgi:hypothetical protein
MNHQPLHRDHDGDRLVLGAEAGRVFRPGVGAGPDHLPGRPPVQVGSAQGRAVCLFYVRDKDAVTWKRVPGSRSPFGRGPVKGTVIGRRSGSGRKPAALPELPPAPTGGLTAAGTTFGGGPVAPPGAGWRVSRKGLQPRIANFCAAIFRPVRA